MNNIKATVSPDGNTLTLEIDLTKRNGLSSSGKSISIASTEGNVSVEGHPEVKMGINVYVKKA